MLSARKWLISGILTCSPLFTLFSQTIYQNYDSGVSYRELTPGVDGSPNPLAASPNANLYKYHPENGFNETQYLQFAYRGSTGNTIKLGGTESEFMNWRIIVPAGYKKTRVTKYPIIIMLHGAGEGGRVWSGNFNYTPDNVNYDNNSKQLANGGQAHQTAVNTLPPNPRAFPGMVIFPQASYNAAWQSGWQGGVLNPNGRMVTQIIQYLIANYDADPDQVYMHGLSNGAEGVWDIAAKRPDLFTAILPISGTPSDATDQTNALWQMPIWLFQGGLDTNPSPQASNTVLSLLQGLGGNPRYTLYPTLGHSCWNNAYAEPDFFSWMLLQSKRNILVVGGDPHICPGGSLRLAISQNMINYQWMLNGSPIAGATSYTYTVPDLHFGTYTVQYTRRIDNAVIVSNPVSVSAKPSSTFVPPVTHTGTLIETVDLGTYNLIYATAAPGYSQYYWFNNGTAISGYNPTTNNVYPINPNGGQGSAADAGSYTVEVLDATGCVSLQSTPLNVIYNSSQPNTNRPVAPNVTNLPNKALKIDWMDYGSQTGWELWRFRFGSSTPPAYSFAGFDLIATLPANTFTYTESGLRPGALYRYVVRALLSDGHAIFSDESNNFLTTTPDTSPPTVPTGLTASNITDRTVTLSWTGSIDDDEVYKYIIYNGSSKLDSIVGDPEGVIATATSKIISGLIPGTTYQLSVQAVDFSANFSQPSDGVTVTTLPPQNGVNYKYWTFTGAMPGTNGSQLLEGTGATWNFNAPPNLSGVINYSTTTPSNYDVLTIPSAAQFTGDPNYFVMSFDAYVEILEAGTYVFSTSGNTGDRLYFNVGGSPTTSVLTNDGTHFNSGTGLYSSTIKSSSAVVLTPGKYPLRVTYFEEHPTTSWAVSLLVQYAETAGAHPFTRTGIPNARLYVTNTTIVNYYLVNTVNPDPSNLLSWTTNVNGSAGGSAPTSFSAAYQYFNLVNQSSVSSTGTWSVSGTGSKVILGKSGTPATLNLSGTFTGTLDIFGSSTVNINTATAVPTFGAVDPTSTINFNIPGNSPIALSAATYGTLNFLSANPVTFAGSTTSVAGNMAVADGVTTAGLPTNLSTLKIGGNLSFANTTTNPLPLASKNMYSLEFVGGKTHTVSFATPVSPSFFSLKADFDDNIVFNNGAAPQTYTFGSAAGGGLILNNGSTLNMGNNNLVITGNGSINPDSETGTIAMNGGNFSMNSPSTLNSNVYFSNTGNAVTNFSSTAGTNGAVNIITPVNVSNVVTLNGGVLNAGSSGQLTLLSDSIHGSASIATIPVGASVSGSITAQRWMNNKQGEVYRYISSPVKGATAAMLQAGFPITGNFTGKNTIPGVPVSGASMYYYQEPNYQTFPATGGTNADTMKVGEGYTAFIRKINGPTTWQVQGPVNQGTINFTPFMTAGSNFPTDGWNLLGNPYPAPIVWTGSATDGWTGFANLSSTVYIRDNAKDGTYQWYIYSPGITSAGPGQQILQNGIIPVGQAFWVQASGVPVLGITEAAKSPAAPSPGNSFYRTTATGSSQATLDVMTITLSSGTLSDVAYIAHNDNSTESYEKTLDAVKQPNTIFNLSTLSKDNIALVINQTPQTYCVKNVKISISNISAGGYSLTFAGIDEYQHAAQVVLTDYFLGTTTSLSSGYVYNFSVTTDPASFGDNRFVISEKLVVATNQVVKGSSICEGNPAVTVASPQQGVYYAAYYNGKIVSDSVVATSDSLKLNVRRQLVGYGKYAISVAGGFAACEKFTLQQSVIVHIDTVAVPVIQFASGYLTAIPRTADQYQWVFDGVNLKGQTQSTTLETASGTYQVTVSTGTCTKESQIYTITGLGETAVATSTVYPNPFKDKLTVTLPESVVDGTATLYNMAGQPIQSTPFNSPDSQPVALRFTNLEPGVYILGVGEHKIRVIKTN